MTGPHSGETPMGPYDNGQNSIQGLPYQGLPPGMAGYPGVPFPRTLGTGSQPVSYPAAQHSVSFPVAQPSGPYPVAQQPVAQQTAEWTYGLPPGVRPDLLKSPLGQHGSMPRTAWEQRGAAKTAFARLVIVELRKLAGTMTDRLLLLLAPIVLVAAAWFGTTINAGYSTSAATEVIGIVLAAHVGLLPLFTTVLKTFSGEWHYRSIQLSLLLQPNRSRYAAAQLVSVLLLWLLAALVLFAVYYPLKSSMMAGTDFPDFVGPRPLWVLGISLLASGLGLLFVLAITFLIANPTAAVTIYLLLAGAFGYRYWPDRPELMTYVDPWQPASLLAGSTANIWPTITSSTLLFVAVGAGLFALRTRDAR